LKRKWGGARYPWVFHKRGAAAGRSDLEQADHYVAAPNSMRRANPGLPSKAREGCWLLTALYGEQFRAACRSDTIAGWTLGRGTGLFLEKAGRRRCSYRERQAQLNLGLAQQCHDDNGGQKALRLRDSPQGIRPDYPLYSASSAKNDRDVQRGGPAPLRKLSVGYIARGFLLSLRKRGVNLGDLELLPDVGCARGRPGIRVEKTAGGAHH